jgi:hypothetical protein
LLGGSCHGRQRSHVWRQFAHGAHDHGGAHRAEFDGGAHYHFGGFFPIFTLRGQDQLRRFGRKFRLGRFAKLLPDPAGIHGGLLGLSQGEREQNCRDRADERAFCLHDVSFS